MIKSIATSGWSTLTSPGTLAMGGGAIFAGGSLLASSLKDPTMPAVGGGRDPEDFKRLREAGGISGTWGRLKAVTSQGMIRGLAEGGVIGGGKGLSNWGAVGGGMSAMSSYGVASFKDFKEAAVTLPHIGTGAAVGAGLGSIIGGVVASKGKGMGKGAVGKMMGLSALMGGFGGAMAVGKVDMAVARTVTAARRNVLSKGRAGRLSNKVKSGGPGYRLWANRTRSAVPVGQPGHLGMNGSMPFAMHKARHRSTV